MSLISGIMYNLRGMWLGVRTPKLLFLGLARFFVIVILTIASTSLFLYYHEQILTLVWTRPDNQWLVWLWQFFSWLLSIILAGVAALFAYLLSQMLFSVVIMDYMSQITERITTGQTEGHLQQPFFQHFFYLLTLFSIRLIRSLVQCSEVRAFNAYKYKEDAVCLESVLCIRMVRERSLTTTITKTPT